MNLEIWFMEARPPFLPLTPITYSVRNASAYIAGSFDLFRALLGFVGVLLAHVSMNVINDYFDYKSGLAFTTKPTPFSGGSGLLPSGTLSAKDVYKFAMGSLIIGSAIGLYFALYRRLDALATNSLRGNLDLLLYGELIPLVYR